MIAVVLGACNGPSSSLRARNADVDRELGEALGIEIPITRDAVVGFGVQSGTGLFAAYVHEGIDEQLDWHGDEFRVWTFDATGSRRADEIDPPGIANASFYVGDSLSSEVSLLVEYGLTPALYLWDGREWSFVDPDHGFDPAETYYVVLDRDRIYAWWDGQVAVWDGAVWRSTPRTEGATLGPVSRDAFRTVSPGPCTRTWDVATLAPSADVCSPGGMEPWGVAVNGTLDEFIATDGATFWRYDGGWTHDALERVGLVFLLATSVPGRAAYSAYEAEDPVALHEARAPWPVHVTTADGTDDVLVSGPPASNAEWSQGSLDASLARYVVLSLVARRDNEVYARAFDAPN